MPIYWVNGARVADNYQDFYDGTWADEANPMNGFGEPRSLASTAPWTGTGHDGTELLDGGASRAVGQSMVGVGAPRFDRQRRRPAQPAAGRSPAPKSAPCTGCGTSWSSTKTSAGRQLVFSGQCK